MRRVFLICLWMVAGAALAADPNEGLILKFMNAWFSVAADTTVTLEQKEMGSGFALYYAHQTRKDQKGGQ